jgi:hypothetical protein
MGQAAADDRVDQLEEGRQGGSPGVCYHSKVLVCPARTAPHFSLLQVAQDRLEVGHAPFKQGCIDSWQWGGPWPGVGLVAVGGPRAWAGQSVQSPSGWQPC